MRLRRLLPLSGRKDRGATAVLVAASLFLLMGMAAVAVDAGIAHSDRRQQASAADVGALAAVQFAKTTLPTTHPDCTGLTFKNRAACRGAQEALDAIDGTLPGRYPDADWNTCVDPDDDTRGFTQNSFISDCISFTSDLRKARVLLPGTDVETAFGRVLGLDTIHVSAFAEAGLEMNISGGVLPFALGPTGAGSNQACFFAQSTSNLNAYPCDGPAQGNFGKLDVRWYGNDLYGAASPECTGQVAWRMAINIITGTDHPMEIYTTSPGVVNDVSNCDLITNPVDEVDVQTGNSAGAIEDGFFNGVTGPTYEGRLMCKDGDAAEDYPAFDYTSGSCVAVNNNHPESMDHTPLWDYLDWTAGQCNNVDNRAEMEQCLGWWKTNAPANTPLFTSDLMFSPRFGAVPQLLNDPGGGTGSYLITGFKPVYLETIYLKCNANTCDVAHSPGEASSGACPSPITAATSSCGWNSSGNKGIEAITAFILTLDMLPGDLAENFPYQPGTLTFNLTR